MRGRLSVLLDWEPDARVDPLEDARCREVDPDIFFPDDSDVRTQGIAKRICRQCPVRQACLERALEMNPRHGIWAGYTIRTLQPKRTKWNREKEALLLASTSVESTEAEVA